MKRNLFTILALLFVATSALKAQTGDEIGDLPVVDVLNLEGSKVSTANFDNKGKPMIIIFWATWCRPCTTLLNKIADEKYDELVEKTGVKLIAISTEDARNADKVRHFVEIRAWDYEVYIDANQDLKRGLDANVPHIFLLDGNGKIVWSHNSYSPGEEEVLYARLNELVATPPGKAPEEK